MSVLAMASLVSEGATRPSLFQHEPEVTPQEIKDAGAIVDFNADTAKPGAADTFAFELSALLVLEQAFR